MNASLAVSGYSARSQLKTHAPSKASFEGLSRTTVVYFTYSEF